MSKKLHENVSKFVMAAATTALYFFKKIQNLWFFCGNFSWFGCSTAPKTLILIFLGTLIFSQLLKLCLAFRKKTKSINEWSYCDTKSCFARRMRSHWFIEKNDFYRKALIRICQIHWEIPVFLLRSTLPLKWLFSSFKQNLRAWIKLFKLFKLGFRCSECHVKTSVLTLPPIMFEMLIRLEN